MKVLFSHSFPTPLIELVSADEPGIEFTAAPRVAPLSWPPPYLPHSDKSPATSDEPLIDFLDAGDFDLLVTDDATWRSSKRRPAKCTIAIAESTDRRRRTRFAQAAKSAAVVAVLDELLDLASTASPRVLQFSAGLTPRLRRTRSVAGFPTERDVFVLTDGCESIPLITYLRATYDTFMFDIGNRPDPNAAHAGPVTAIASAECACTRQGKHRAPEIDRYVALGITYVQVCHHVHYSKGFNRRAGWAGLIAAMPRLLEQLSTGSAGRQIQSIRPPQMRIF